MRICFITSSYPRFEQDGNARSIRSLAEAMAALGHQVHVVAPYAAQVLPYNSPAQVHWFRYVWPVRLHVMGHGQSLSTDTGLRLSAFTLLPLYLLSAFRTLMRVTEAYKSQVIYVHWVLPSGLVAAWVAKLRKIPFVISVHGSDMFAVSRNRLIRAVARWVFRHAGAVIACSPELREAVISLGAPKDTLLLAWGADPQLFHPVRRTLENRRTFGWGETELVVSALGRMLPKKGFSNLIRAMPTVLKRYPQTRLVFGGDGPLYQELVREAKELGITDHVSFPGRISWDRVPDFLAAADIFVLPSVRDEQGNMDGLPSVLLDAMSSGTPVIASEIAGVSLVVEHDRTGILVPPGDVPALANAILSLIEDTHKRKLVGQAGRHAIEERFNWASVARRITDLMEQVVRTGLRSNDHREFRFLAKKRPERL